MSLYAVKNDDGEWLGWEVYQDDPEFICGGGSVWTDLDKAKFYAKANGGHVVELVEAPAKVVVSEAEAEMLELANAEGTVSPTRIIMDFVASKGTPHSWALEDRLMRAYVNGWEAETEAKWYVQTPKEWWAQPDAPEYMSLDQLGVVIGSKKFADKFTRAELKQYHFDSDIFTLVPVEEDKEVSR